MLDRLGDVPLGRRIALRPARSDREYELTVRLIRPRLLWELLRSRDDVLVVQELNLIAGFAVLSKLVRRRAVVALIEGDLVSHVGASGSAFWKRAFRRLLARSIDVFAANSSEAVAYLKTHVGARPEAVLEGWWLAGHADLDAAQHNGGAAVTAGEPPQPGGVGGHGPPDQEVAEPAGLTFLAAGRLVPPKGIDLLIEAFAEAHAGGPHRLVVAGEGPQRSDLDELLERRGLATQVELVGEVDRMDLATMMRSSDVFVFPTLQDLVGRVAIEALSLATPVIASVHAGAAGTAVRHDVNGLVVDPRDPVALRDALKRVTDPQVLASLRAGARREQERFAPTTAARHVLAAIGLARERIADRSSQGAKRARTRVRIDDAARRT